METKHTPGPWKALSGTWVVGPNGETVCIMRNTRPSAKADAALAAAAPEMEAALAGLDEWLATEFPPNVLDRRNEAKRVELLRAARLALIKARGEA